MRDIGIFTSESISTDELVSLVGAFALRAGHPVERRQGEVLVGRLPDVLYVSASTEPSNGYFGAEEKTALESQLNAPVRSYVSIHFGRTDEAYGLAESLAEEISRYGAGTVDYSGCGGRLGQRPTGVQRTPP